MPYLTQHSLSCNTVQEIATQISSDFSIRQDADPNCDPGLFSELLMAELDQFSHEQHLQALKELQDSYKAHLDTILATYNNSKRQLMRQVRAVESQLAMNRDLYI